MLISIDDLAAAGVQPRSVLHIGAHHCEEANDYNRLGWPVTWVEAQEHLVRIMQDAGLNVIHGAIWSSRKTLCFYETNNGQSSSLLPLGTHLEHYPHIQVQRTYVVDTITIDELNLTPDFLNLDIQGAELEALNGAERTLQGVQWIYSEISVERLYENQPLEHDLNAWLSERGLHQTMRAMTGQGWGDAFYCRVT